MAWMKVLLIRHGMTEGNRKRQYIGTTDEPVCPEGMQQLRLLKKQARDMDRDYKSQLVFISPMLRCRQTAEILFDKVPDDVRMIPVPALREMDFGVFEGRAWKDDLEHDPQYLKWLETECEGAVPGGERRQEFADRCLAGFCQAMKEAKELGRRQRIETVAFVVHGGTLMSILSGLSEEPGNFYSFMADNGHGYAGYWDGRKLSGICKI